MMTALTRRWPTLPDESARSDVAMMATKTEDNTIETIGLGVTFENRRRATAEVLRDVNLAIRPGEFVSLVGASGCGKTTLLRTLAGLTDASAGSVLIGGARVTGPDRERAVVFQQDGLYPWRTVLRNVRLGLEVAGISRAASNERSREVLRLVGLEGWENHYPHELSGGMKQRVNLARALVLEPKILFMDEPFAALDAQTREMMQRELLDLWARLTATVVFVTHQIDEAVYLSDRVIVLGSQPGRVKATIPVEYPRPRELSLKRSGSFGELEQRIWTAIEEDVKSAFVKTQ